MRPRHCFISLKSHALRRLSTSNGSAALGGGATSTTPIWANLQANAPTTAALITLIGGTTAATYYVAEAKATIRVLEAKMAAEKELRAKDIAAQAKEIAAEKELRAKEIAAEKEVREKDVEAARSAAETFALQKLFAADFSAEYESFREKLAEDARKQAAEQASRNPRKQHP